MYTEEYLTKPLVKETTLMATLAFPAVDLTSIRALAAATRAGYSDVESMLASKKEAFAALALTTPKSFGADMVVTTDGEVRHNYIGLVAAQWVDSEGVLCLHMSTGDIFRWEFI
jgi:hypothetical protein